MLSGRLTPISTIRQHLYAGILEVVFEVLPIECSIPRGKTLGVCVFKLSITQHLFSAVALKCYSDIPQLIASAGLMASLVSWWANRVMVFVMLFPNRINCILVMLADLDAIPRWNRVIVQGGTLVALQGRGREIFSLSAFLRTEDIRVHIVHISRLIITYTLE